METQDKYQGLSPETTLRETKQWLKEKVIDQGKPQRCPCCSQLCAVYRRKITATAAVALAALYRYFPRGEFVHKSEIAKKVKGLSLSLGGGDFAKCHYFGLIKEKQKSENDDKRTSGYWALTPQGESFCRGLVKLPKYAIVYDGRVLRHEGDFITLKDCFSEKFSYAEIMGGEAP